MLVKIGDTDITKYILSDSYEVNSIPVYNSWQDANYVFHREIHRYRVHGSFQLKFLTEAEYKAFIDVMKQNAIESAVIMTVYVNNKCELQTTTCFCEMSPILQKAHSRKIFKEFDFMLEER